MDNADSSSRPGWISRVLLLTVGAVVDCAYSRFMKHLVLLIVLCLEIGAVPLPQSQEERFGVRLLAVRSEPEASRLRAQSQAGASFETLAKEHSIDPSSKDGGFLGLVRPADLSPEFQRALERLMPGQLSAVITSGREYLLLQRLSTEEANWIVSNEAGVQAFEKERYDEAAQSFRQAVQHAEKLTPVDYRLEESLHGLAESYRLQKKYSEAEPIYRRYLAVHWGGPSAPEVLDRFSALLALAYFRDAQFTEALRKFEQALDRAPLSENLYQAMSGMLFKAQLMPEAEAVMLRAASLFPASKDVHYFQAQLYRSGLNTKKALDAFDRLSRMKPPANIDPSTDRLQQSVVYQKIASIRVELVQYEEASAAYKRALEILPDSLESRLGLGDVYLQQGKLEDALAEYERVIAADPQQVAANFRVADTNLRMGRFDTAVAAASKVLTLDPGHRRAHYVLATALVRAGEKERAEKQLELYRKVEAEAQAQINRGRDIVVLNRGAAAKLLEGRLEESIEMFLKVIEAYPDSPAHYLNLGIAQSKLGRHKAALETFQKMLSLGMDDSFLVYRNVAHEYELLGDMEASRRHRVVYLQNLDVALRETLASSLD
jgi:tetratricopeptide (TPR) repeat protein